ncbi:MAG: glycosyltransferase [Clostridia bacterium]|nr:glycosyltransferase [Clostridia bacterium]
MGDITIKNQFNLLGGITPILYGTNEYHRLLSDENIGEEGENLTIVVLSCERAKATIGMMNSIKQYIPNFKGKYLVADNGSSKETIQELKQAFEEMPYECEILEFGENLGVAKGRNKAVEHVTTEWFMSLDNDILLSTNILPEIQQTISQLGCKFVNLPLLNETADHIFSTGGNLFIEPISNGIHIGCGGAFEQSECSVNQIMPRSLSTFLFGGASVIHKPTFEECGKFDEGMFVGFEDVDFSITLFKKGYKIGTIGILGLIHDHKKPQSQSDLEYERQRFSNIRLLKSAQYFEKKRGFKVWNEGTEAWLKQREKELGIETTIENSEKKKEKRKIAVVIDERDSQFDQEWKKIKPKIEEACEVKEIYLKDIKNSMVYLLMGIKNSEKVYVIDSSLWSNLEETEVEKYIEKYHIERTTFWNRYVEPLNLIAKSKEPMKLLDKDVIVYNEIDPIVNFLLN